jgi:hypothetical protein
MRRLVRSRVVNNARTATRNFDLPLAMEGPHLNPQPVYCTDGFRPAYGSNTAGTPAGLFIYNLDCGHWRTQFWFDTSTDT